MFELSIALRYLLPRRRQLSVSIIALLSVLVISLVVWLILVFFSITHGMERRWMDSFVTFHSPLQLTPTERYFHSYYYEVDRYSADSGYRHLSIGEKLHALHTDPYDPTLDGELPHGFPPRDLNSQMELKDPVRGAEAAIRALSSRFPGLAVRDYELSLSGFNLSLIRPLWPQGKLEERQRLNQLTTLASFDGSNRRLQKKVAAPTSDDLSNLLTLLSSDVGRGALSPALLDERLERFFANAEVTALRTGNLGWPLAPDLFEGQTVSVRGVGLVIGSHLQQVALSLTPSGLDGVVKSMKERGWQTRLGTLRLMGGQWSFSPDGGEPLVSPERLEAWLPAGTQVAAHQIEGLRFELEDRLQGYPFHQEVDYPGWAIGSAKVQDQFEAEPSLTPLWVYRVAGEMRLPTDPLLGDGLLVASTFRKSGVQLGDLGELAYYAQTGASSAEQRLPSYVAGFYDPGFMPVGAKLLFVDPAITTLVRSSMQQFAPREGNGLQVWVDDLAKVDELKRAIEGALERAGIADYWRVENFKEYEISRALVEQFQSDRTLFSMISIIIISVACSNIISMLILLVNDKRKEIGILLAMGASKLSVAAIFGFCGVALGATSCLIGIGAALLTLNHLDLLIRGLSFLQGHQAFNPIFFGESLPSELSLRALSFALLATVLLSLIAGLIPAIKASRIRPSSILRSE